MNKKYTNSVIDPEKLRDLNSVRKLTFFQRVFRMPKSGSERVLIISWIRMTIGTGVFMIPSFFKIFGIVPMFFLLIVVSILTLASLSTIFEQAIETNSKSFSEVVNKVFPGSISKIFSITLSLDYISVFLATFVITWNIIKNIALEVGLLNYWIIKENKLEVLDEDRISFFILRLTVMLIIYLLISKLLIKESIESLKNLSFLTIGKSMTLIVYIMIENIFYRKSFLADHSLSTTYFQTPNISWVTYFFNVLTSFYIQPYSMGLRKELFYPTLRRLKKTSLLSVLLVLILYIIFGFFTYYCHGNNGLSSLIIFRKKYTNKNVLSEIVFYILVFSYSILNLLSLSTFNVIVRTYLKSLFIVKNDKRAHLLFSLIPALFAVLMAALIPDLLKIIGYFGLTIYNFNGFILPHLLRIKTELGEERNKLIIGSSLLLVLFFSFMGIFGLYTKIFY